MTVLDGKKRVFYAHVPKTGGTYIEDLFVVNGYAKKFWTASPKQCGLQVSFQHFDRIQYEACIDFSLIDLAFITVRHPIDRLLSEYRNSGNGQDISLWIKKIRNVLVRNPSFLDNHFRPQVDFYRPPMHIFRQEDKFSERWASNFSVDNDLSFHTFTTTVKRDTSSKERPLSRSEASAVIRFCLEYYRADFHTFGYKVSSARSLQPIISDLAVPA